MCKTPNERWAYESVYVFVVYTKSYSIDVLCICTILFSFFFLVAVAIHVYEAHYCRHYVLEANEHEYELNTYQQI